MMKLFIPVLLLIVHCLTAVAQVAKYSNEFLNIGVDARAFGMANSVVATSKNVGSAYWNPAGLVHLQTDAELSLMHSEYFAGIAKYDYGAMALRIDDQSVAGLSLIRFGVDDIPNTLDLIDSDGNIRYDRISTFSVADYAMLFSYARKSAREGLSYGANAKLIYRKTGDLASAWGFGFDAGLRYRIERWRLGIIGRDITSTFNAWSFQTDKFEEVFLATGNELPENALEITLPRLILGAARDFSISETTGLLVEVDAGITFDGKRNTLIAFKPVSLDPHIGLEFDYKELVFLRMGMGNMQFVKEFQDERALDFQPAIGMGLHVRNLRVDYSLTDLADQSYALYSHIFSLVFAFDIPKLKSSSN